VSARLDRVSWLDKGWQSMCIGFCPSKEAWDHAVRRAGYDPTVGANRYPGGHAACCSFFAPLKPKGHAFCLVTVADRVDAGCSRNAAVGLICHESVHVWQYVAKEMMEKRPSWEFEAYSIQAIFQMVLAAYDRLRWDPAQKRAKAKKKGAKK
jgi:hypothetical protein